MTTVKPFATTSHAMAEALARLGREAVAEVVGVSASTIYKACNPNMSHGLRFLTWDHCKTLAALLRSRGEPEWFSIAFETEVARLLQTVEDGPGASLETLALEVAAETGDVQRALFEAISPDSEGGREITPNEASRAVAEIDQALDRLQAMRRQLVAAALLNEPG